MTQNKIAHSVKCQYEKCSQVVQSIEGFLELQKRSKVLPLFLFVSAFLSVYGKQFAGLFSYKWAILNYQYQEGYDVQEILYVCEVYLCLPCKWRGCVISGLEPKCPAPAAAPKNSQNHHKFSQPTLENSSIQTTEPIVMFHTLLEMGSHNKSAHTFGSSLLFLEMPQKGVL